MSIRTREGPRESAELERLRRKSRQAWDMAGLARQDGDTKDEARRTAEAREWDRQIGELVRMK